MNRNIFGATELTRIGRCVRTLICFHVPGCVVDLCLNANRFTEGRPDICIWQYKSIQFVDIQCNGLVNILFHTSKHNGFSQFQFGKKKQR